VKLTPALAVEKVLYRLALLHEGSVSAAQAFLELPISLEEVEQYGDHVADGRSVVRNDFGEYLAYDFPELQRQMPAPPQDCPTCFGDIDPAPTEGGQVQRPGLICDTCYGSLQSIQTTEPDETTFAKLSHFFRGEEESEDLKVVARIEHEIFFLALRSDLPQFTHTTIAAQSRLPADQIKERLDRMAARRYLKVGLLPTGDAVAYSIPQGLTYPRALYERHTGESLRPPSRRLELGVESRSEEPASAPKSWPSVRATPRTPAKPPPKITIKSRRQRPPSGLTPSLTPRSGNPLPGVSPSNAAHPTEVASEDTSEPPAQTVGAAIGTPLDADSSETRSLADTSPAAEASEPEVDAPSEG
jgi:hypothetical protein